MSGHRLDEDLSHIVESIERIERFTHGFSRADFIANELVQDAVLRNIEIVGEASHKIEVLFPEFATAHPELPLSIAYHMRNSVSHGYLGVDLGVVWNTIKSDLPHFGSQVQAILAN